MKKFRNMRVIKDIPISNIVVDRIPLNRTLGLVKHLEQGGTVPPIKVEYKDGTYILKDGRHRVAAYKLLGRRFISAKFYLSL